MNPLYALETLEKVARVVVIGSEEVKAALKALLESEDSLHVCRAYTPEYDYYQFVVFILDSADTEKVLETERDIYKKPLVERLIYSEKRGTHHPQMRSLAREIGVKLLAQGDSGLESLAAYVKSRIADIQSVGSAMHFHYMLVRAVRDGAKEDAFAAFVKMSEADKGLGRIDALLFAGEYLDGVWTLPEDRKRKLELGRLRLIRERLLIDPEHPEALFLLGKLYYEEGKFGLAFEVFERLAQMNEGHPRRHYLAGHLALWAGEYKRAVEIFYLGFAQNRGLFGVPLAQAFFAAGHTEYGKKLCANEEFSREVAEGLLAIAETLGRRELRAVILGIPLLAESLRTRASR